MGSKRRDFLKLGAAVLGSAVSQNVLAQFAPVGLYQNPCASPHPPSSCPATVNFIFSSGGNVHRSADALNWTSSPHGLPAGYSVQCSAYCNGKWILGLLDGGGNTGAYLAHSTDAISWTLTPNLNAGSGSRYPVNVVYFNGLYIASGGDSPGWISTSPDLVTWTARTPNIGGTYMSAAACNGSVAVVGSNSLEITSSSNGTTWTARTSNLSGGSIAIWDIQWLNSSLFLAMSSNGTLSTSPDGQTWTSRTTGFGATHVRSAAYGASRYVIVGNSTYGYSSNGTTWSLSTGPAVGLSVVRFFGTKFYAPSGTSMITSTDGINWNTEATNIGSFSLVGPYNFAIKI